MTTPTAPRLPTGSSGPTRCAGALLAAAALTAGCGNVTQLHVDDRSSPIVSARAVHRFGGGPGGAGLELEVSSVRARGEQRLSAFESVSVGTQSVTGPALLVHNARVQHAQLVYNHRLFAGRPAELEWFVGAAWVQATWESVSFNTADPRLSNRTNWYGPAGGVLGRLRLAPLLALELRYSAAIDLSTRRDGASRNSTEAAFAFRAAPALLLRAGLGESRSWVQPDSSSELAVRVRGPFVSLGLDF